MELYVHEKPVATPPARDRAFSLSSPPFRPRVAQGIQTGVITGVITRQTVCPLPGVTVTATSPNLQGPRSAVTDANGVYYLRGLTPGLYLRDVRDPVLPGRLAGGRRGERRRTGGGRRRRCRWRASPKSVTVNAEAPSAIATPRTSQTYTKAEVDVLPVGRRPLDIAELSPGVTTNVFNICAGRRSSGSFGYDNVFMVNGVDINDNVFGTPNNLFIEDAVEETTVLTHGISAQYGRFSGGVINIVTRSGGNTFSGSFREGLSNPAWIGQTPLEKAGNIKHVDVLSKTHEGTFGGPLVRDRLWFFAAGRYETANIPNTFAQNGAGYTRTDTNRRGELKITGTFAAAQTVQASFIGNATEQVNASALNAAALLDASMLTTRQLPNRLMALNYHGSVTPAAVRRRAVFGEEAELQEQRRHEHRHPRLAVPDGWRDAGRARGAGLQRAVPRRDRPREPQQPAVHGQPRVPAGDRAASAATS